MKMIQVYDRKSKECYVEKEFGKGLLEFLYGNPVGRIILKTFIINKFYSKIKGMRERSKGSRKKIAEFIKEYDIDMTRYEEKEYKSFDEFFTRRLRKTYRELDCKKKDFISPADAKLQVYKIDNRLRLKIKGTDYNLEELLKNDKITNNYRNGYCLVYRLSVDDYHRYCHIDDGELVYDKVIKGKLHTVRPISSRYKVFKENQREYMILNTENLGEMIYMEVGAMQIGKINNHDLSEFKKGQEKGYFSYGASTIVIIVQNNKVKIDDDILKMNKKNIEVKVKYGERIGKIL